MASPADLAHKSQNKVMIPATKSSHAQHGCSAALCGHGFRLLGTLESAVTWGERTGNKSVFL